MASGAARVAQRTDPRKCRVTYAGKPAKWSEVWNANPRIARLSEVGDFQDLPGRDMANMRPYHTGKTPERWSYNLDFRPEVGELYFTNAERSFAAQYRPQIVVEPHIKPGASPNKQWPHWHKFARIATDAGYELTQLGASGTRALRGARMIVTPTFKLACAVLARARAVVTHEGGLHHAAAALGVPGVVIFGHFTPVELTGYAIHRNLGVSLGEACGMRVPCTHCAAAMKAITPEAVFRNLTEVLNGQER